MFTYRAVQPVLVQETDKLLIVNITHQYMIIDEDWTEWVWRSLAEEKVFLSYEATT